MRLRVIACEVFFREICAIAAQCPNMLDLVFLTKGLHDRKSAEMRAALQQVVDDTPAGFDAVVFAYALCGNGLAGIQARSIPVVIPRAHDCIALFLGSRHKYQEYFDRNPGVYFKTPGWIERGGSTDRQLTGFDIDRRKLAEKYGEENADYLMEQMGRHTQTYHQFTYIRTGAGPEDRFESATRAEAAARNWQFESLQGDLGILERLLAGDWDSDDFVQVLPGWVLAATWDERIIEAKQ